MRSVNNRVMTGYRDTFDDSSEEGEARGEGGAGGEGKGGRVSERQRQREWAKWRRKAEKRRTKLKHRVLTEFACRRPSWRSFTEIGAGFSDLDVVDDDVSSTS